MQPLKPHEKECLYEKLLCFYTCRQHCCRCKHLSWISVTSLKLWNVTLSALVRSYSNNYAAHPPQNESHIGENTTWQPLPTTWTHAKQWTNTLITFNVIQKRWTMSWKSEEQRTSNMDNSSPTVTNSKIHFTLHSTVILLTLTCACTKAWHMLQQLAQLWPHKT